MHSWEKFNETMLPSKESCYSEFNLEKITDEDYDHAQKVWDTFKIKNLAENSDLYVQSDTLLLSDIFEELRDTCIEIYELDPAHFLSASRLAWQALELLTDYEKYLIIESGIKGDICQSIHRYAKANNKYMKNYNRNIPLPFLEYYDANNLYGWAMCKTLPIGNFRWTDNLSKYTEYYIEKYKIVILNLFSK